MSRKESTLEPCSESAFANTWGAGLLPRHTGAAPHCPDTRLRQPTRGPQHPSRLLDRRAGPADARDAQVCQALKGDARHQRVG